MAELHAMPWEAVIAEAVAILERHGELPLATEGDPLWPHIDARTEIYHLAVMHGTTSAIILAAIANQDHHKTEPNLEGDLKRQDRKLAQVVADLERWTSDRSILQEWMLREMETLLIEIRNLRDMTGKAR